jgi:cholest-4-en-3-one 26-monooxygenase
MSGPPPARVPAGVCDLADPESYAAGPPHEIFTRLRAEAPVVFHPERRGGGFWAVTRWADVRAVSLDQATFSSWQAGVMLRDFAPDLLASQRETIVAMEPGRHQKHRRLVAGAFTPKVIRDLEPRIRGLVGSILDGVAPRGSCDFVTDVACELPVIAICELLGVPVEDRAQILAWSNAMVGMDDPEYATEPGAGHVAAMQLAMYANGLAEARRADPRDDLVTALVRAEVDGEQLGAAGFNALVLVLAVAGNETTRNLISGGLQALFEHPAERARLQADLSLVPTAVEEMLRWVTPVMHFRRTVVRDVTLAGQHLRAGDKVVMFYVSANRDEAVFADPARFDVGRTPNDHVAFGFGSHFCLGASLAQLEARVLFEELLQRLPDIAAAGPAERLRTTHFNALKHLPVRFAPETGRRFV